MSEPALFIAFRTRVMRSLLSVLGLMGIMIMPLPPIALDLLLVTSISVALLVFLLTVYAKRPIGFHFPTPFLITTVFRLALNVASTRLSPEWRRRRRPLAGSLTPLGVSLWKATMWLDSLSSSPR